MVNLRRNMQEFYYANIKTMSYDEEEMQDKISYSTPVTANGNIASPTSYALTKLFGKDIAYDRIILLADAETDISETTIIWIKNSIDKKHDYEVVRVAASLNTTVIAIKSVT